MTVFIVHPHKGLDSFPSTEVILRKASGSTPPPDDSLVTALDLSHYYFLTNSEERVNAFVKMQNNPKEFK